MTQSYVDPTRAAFDLFKSLPRDTSINMLNLVRFRDLAAYPEGHEHVGARVFLAFAERRE